MSSSTQPEWEPPRCIHGFIILACPEDDCPTQGAYLDQQDAAVREYNRTAMLRLLSMMGLDEINACHILRIMDRESVRPEQAPPGPHRGSCG